MENLRICITQFDQVWENKTVNFANFEKWLANIEPCDIIVLPEMFSTGFSMNADNLAEEMHNSPSVTWLTRIAKEKNAAIYTSFIVKENISFFNRGIFMQPNGKFFVYDKRKTFSLAGESDVFSKGEIETIVTYRDWRINLQICYDLRFPEQVRNSIATDGKSRYDVILYTANWPEKRISHWNTLLQARAIENQSFVVGVNRIGTDNSNLNYTGESAVYNALGEKTSTLNKNVNSVEVVEISAQELNTLRTNLPFLKDI
jgi:omega-amidase